MIEVKDIEGRVIQVGDEVYYSRKHPYHAKGILVKCTVTKINDNGNVSLGKYTSTSPEKQIIIIQSVREKKFERIISD